MASCAVRYVGSLKRPAQPRDPGDRKLLTLTPSRTSTAQIVLFPVRTRYGTLGKVENTISKENQFLLRVGGPCVGALWRLPSLGIPHARKSSTRDERKVDVR